jgi:precorrin-6A/cobalt-precorrin-6A reductase
MEDGWMNILVMAGTHDAVQIIKMLSKNIKSTINDTESFYDDKNGFWILATTTTDYGAQLAKKAGAHEVIPKARGPDEMVDLIENRKIEVLIDATHPFAAEATRTAIYAAQKADIHYIRFERPYLEIEKSALIHRVDSFDEAGKLALKLSQKQDNCDGSGKILHLAGVSTLKSVLKHVDTEKLFVRVLPSILSLEKCLDLGLSGENILAMQGVFSKEFNKSLMKEYGVCVIITKESGETGGVPSKIEAAQDLNVDIVLVSRPKIAELNQKIVVSSLEDLEKELADLIS